MVRVVIRTSDTADIEEFMPEREQWLNSHMAGKSWKHQPGADGTYHFEDFYDIEDERVAVLFKLTFGGQ